MPVHRLPQHRARGADGGRGGGDGMTALQEPAQEQAEIGRDRRRKEDQRLITGRTRWTDNLTLPGMLHLAMVRSPLPHATITSIDTANAKASPNVVAVLTGADLGEAQGACINAWPIVPDQVTPPHLPMPSDRVAFAGEIVAVVVARSAAAARDAVELVEVEYDDLPAALDLKEAAAAHENGGVLAHPDLGTNVSAVWAFDSAEAGTGGDVEEAIATARESGIVIEREYRQQRLIPAFMEPRSVVVDPTGEQITMWSATQVPHIMRFALAATTGVPESKIRVIAPDVGGGFGGKLQQTPEEMIAFAVARRLGKPVKYTETRSESLVSAHHGRDQWQRLTLAADKDGHVTGLKVDLLADLGAYVAIVGGGVPVLGAFMFNAIYKFPAYRFQTTNILTNKAWTDAYRGAGRPEATYAIERLMDELAAEVGVDPLEIRERNWIKHEEFPFTTVAGLEYDSGNYEAATARAKELFGYDALRAEQKQRRESGDRVQLGIGVSTFTEMCGLAPSRVLGSLNYGAGGWEHAEVRMLPTGKVEVVTGASAHGQGHETAFSQIVADRLGVPFEDVEILHGDTAIAHKGLDTYGSRSLVVGGEALVRAVDKVIEKAKPVAAHLLEASIDDLEFGGGRFTVRGTDQGMAITEIATAVFAAHNLPDGMEASIDAEATYDPVNFNYPHGTHLCAVEVDTETGQVTMRKYAACDDIGHIINPLIVAGQVHGGLVQGIAQALWEEAVYDENGTLVTGSFVDYLLPTSADTISFDLDHTTSPATTNSLGTKGVGEAGTIASTPAVVNAVVDAIRHLGVNDVRMPCTPERVWRAIWEGSAGGATTGAAAPHFDPSTGMSGTVDRSTGGAE
ncbi:molybdopterin-dependent oxidoreductase [Nocardioides maradonensis]